MVWIGQRPPKDLLSAAGWTFVGGVVGGMMAESLMPRSIAEAMISAVSFGGIAIWLYASSKSESKPNSVIDVVISIAPVALGMCWASLPGGVVGMFLLR
jgi:hypothetical protein